MPSPDAGQRFVELLSVMARLRGEGGCPWDREQTRESLRPFLIEEAYEVLEALDGTDPARVREELGDLLFQVVFHAEIARERDEFDMTGLLAALIEKMVRRHPHVFGDRTVNTASEALRQWEAIKQAEGDTRRSALHGIPRSLPGLLRAQRIQHRAARVGFDWPDPLAALEKVREEAEELGAALREGDAEAARAEVGDLLFAVVNVARLAELDPESALQSTIERFRARFQWMEDAADEGGRELRSLTLEELERLWTEAKARERG
jgi:tetrapyrrole methylase family protein/MazG family protein